MTNVLDWILDLFRDPVQAQSFINDPDKTMQNAGVQNLSAAQVNAVAASVAPAAVIQGGGNPVHGLQQAVAQTHGIAFAPESQHVFAPQTQAFSNNDTLSHNDVLSNNDPHILSPQAGHDSQQGGVNLDFGDITLGDKNTASDGSVINTGTAGDIDNTNVHGDGNVVGDGNVGANTGDILASEGSTVQAGGLGNTSDSHGSSTIHNSGGGDVISGNEGPVVKTGDIDTSGGNASGGAGGHGGGILGGGGGDGGAANAGGGGQVVISPVQTTTTDTHGGDITTVDTHGGDISGSVDASHDDNSTGHNTDNSTHDSHNDNSMHDSHDDNSQHNPNVDTDVDVSII
jgi:hypothetical protein